MALLAFGLSSRRLVMGRARPVRIGDRCNAILRSLSPARRKRAWATLQLIADLPELLLTIWEAEILETMRYEANGVVVYLHSFGDFGLTAVHISVTDPDGGGDSGHRLDPDGRADADYHADICRVWDSDELQVVPPNRVAAFKGIERDLVASLFTIPKVVGPVTVRRAGDPPLRVIPLVQRFGQVSNLGLHGLCFTSAASAWPASRTFRLDPDVPIGGIEVKILPDRNRGIDSPRSTQIYAHLMRLGMGSGISRRAVQRAAEILTINDRWSLARLDLCVDDDAGVSAQVALASLRSGPTGRVLTAVSWVSRLGGRPDDTTRDGAPTGGRFGQLRRAHILAEAKLQFLALIEDPDG
jgi:hypothetical protein